MIVDAHAHPFFRDWSLGHARGEERPVPEDWRRIVRRIHGRELEMPTFDEFLERKRSSGIDRIVIFGRDTETRTGESSFNEWVIELAERYPSHFVPFMAIDPNKGLQVAEGLRDAVIERGVRGVKIHPYAAQLPPNDRRCYPLYEFIEELGIPIVFHSGPGPLGARLDYSHPRHFDDLGVDFPGLKVILAHFSGPFYLEAHSLAWRYENFYVDISFMPSVYLDSLPWSFFERTIPDKILMGSDYPMVLPDERLGDVERLPVREETRRRIAGENAARLLGLKSG